MCSFVYNDNSLLDAIVFSFDILKAMITDYRTIVPYFSIFIYDRIFDEAILTNTRNQYP